MAAFAFIEDDFNMKRKLKTEELKAKVGGTCAEHCVLLVVRAAAVARRLPSLLSFKVQLGASIADESRL